MTTTSTSFGPMPIAARLRIRNPAVAPGSSSGVGTHAGVDEHGLAGGPDHGRVEGRVAVALRNAVCTVGRAHLVDRRVEHEPLRDRCGTLAVGDDDDLDLADHVGM